MRSLVKEQSIILKMNWHLLIPHQIMKYLSEPKAVVSFLVYSTKFIQQSFIECPSMLGPGLRAMGTRRGGEKEGEATVPTDWWRFHLSKASQVGQVGRTRKIGIHIQVYGLTKNGRTFWMAGQMTWILSPYKAVSQTCPSHNCTGLAETSFSGSAGNKVGQETPILPKACHMTSAILSLYKT